MSTHGAAGSYLRKAAIMPYRIMAGPMIQNKPVFSSRSSGRLRYMPKPFYVDAQRAD